MPPLFHLSIIAALFVLYKAISNLLNWLKLKNLKKLYLTYGHLYSEEAKEKRNNDSFTDKEKIIAEKLEESSIQIATLFRKAGLQSFLITVTQPTGFNYMQHQQIDLFENLSSMLLIGDVNIPDIIIRFFSRSIGVYKSRVIEAINPIYWIDTIIFLPRNIISYLGYPIESKKINLISKVLNIVYWLICFAFAFFHLTISIG